MSKLKNTIVLHNEYAEIIVESKEYRHTVKIDIEDIATVGKVRVSKDGYAYLCRNGGKSVAHVVMKYTTIRGMVVDHVNGDRLDNRKANLRVITIRENTQNKYRFVRNNTGVVGISYRKNGRYEYYRVSLTDPHSKPNKNGQGRRITKQFNINRLGKDLAFSKAKEYLEYMKEKLGYINYK